MGIKKNEKTWFSLFHVICWGVIFFAQIMLGSQHQHLTKVMYLLKAVTPAALCATFYVNYLWLVPSIFMKKRWKKSFLIANAIIIVVMAIAIEHSTDLIQNMGLSKGGYSVYPCRESCYKFSIAIIVKNAIPLVVSASIALMIHFSLRWHKAEQARQVAEMEKTDAELKTLRTNIHPHFLLNTLNNIYALIAFDQTKAQNAVSSLSTLLRQMLYNSQEKYISFKDEVDFLKSYIDLMRIRLQSNVDLQTSIKIPDCSGAKVAPHIFISLIENAFKHGISSTQPSFIKIDLHADDNTIVCDIVNSYFPKNEDDHSAHGIGLDQVKKLLEQSYPSHYEWTKGINKKNNTYQSKIVIHDPQMCYH